MSFPMPKLYQSELAIRAIADEYGVSVMFLCGGEHMADSKVVSAMCEISRLSFSDKSTFEDTANFFGCGEPYASYNTRSTFVSKGSDRDFIDQSNRISARADLLEGILKPVYELSKADRDFFFVIVDSMFEVSKIPVSDFLDMDFYSPETDEQRSILVYLSQCFTSKKLQNAIAEILKTEVNAFHDCSQIVTATISQDSSFKETMDSIVNLILAVASSK